MSMLQNPHFLFARMGQSPSCRNLIALEENQSLSHFLQAKVTLGSLSLSLSHFLILGFFKDISEFVFFFVSFSVCLAANCFCWFFSSAYNAFYGVHR